MCGRFVISDTTPDLVALFDIDEAGDDLPGPSWNIKPTEQVPIVLDSNRDGPIVRRLASARWTLVPPFATELTLKYPTFNARSETAAEKPTFRASVASRRAILPAAGYYEWHTEGKTKTPYYIHQPEAGIAFAGLYSWWKDAAKANDDPARWVLTATMLTSDAEGELAKIHPRNPVMIPAEFWDDWLDPDRSGDQSLVDDAVAASRDVTASLQMHEVAPVRGNGPELIDPVG